MLRDKCYYRRRGLCSEGASGVVRGCFQQVWQTMATEKMDDAWKRLHECTLSVDQSREVDRVAVEDYGMHSLVLMENAALVCVDWLLHRCPAPLPTTILCGRGNNGGDGLAIARQLTNRGWPCQTILLGPPDRLSVDARANLQILTAGKGTGGMEILTGPLPPQVLARLKRSSVIMDALLGTGAGGAPREPMRGWLQAANQCQALRVAVDVPTGIDAETGEAHEGHFLPTATLTFVAKKPAMADPKTAAVFGEIYALPIGIPLQMMHEIVATWQLATR